jgi:hypothetical protein
VGYTRVNYLLTSLSTRECNSSYITGRYLKKLKKQQQHECLFCIQKMWTIGYLFLQNRILQNGYGTNVYVCVQCSSTNNVCLFIKRFNCKCVTHKMWYLLQKITCLLLLWKVFSGVYVIFAAFNFLRRPFFWVIDCVFVRV